MKNKKIESLRYVSLDDFLPVSKSPGKKAYRTRMLHALENVNGHGHHAVYTGEDSPLIGPRFIQRPIRTVGHLLQMRESSLTSILGETGKNYINRLLKPYDAHIGQLVPRTVARKTHL